MSHLVNPQEYNGRHPQPSPAHHCQNHVPNQHPELRCRIKEKNISLHFFHHHHNCATLQVLTYTPLSVLHTCAVCKVLTHKCLRFTAVLEPRTSCRQQRLCCVYYLCNTLSIDPYTCVCVTHLCRILDFPYCSRLEKAQTLLFRFIS